MHLGKGRQIQPGQKIHPSVAFSPSTYIPRAILPRDERTRRPWQDLIKFQDHTEFVCPEGWEALLEEDIFKLDLPSANSVIDGLENSSMPPLISINRLTVMTQSGMFTC